MKVSQYLAETNLFYPWTYIWYKNGLIKMVKKKCRSIKFGDDFSTWSKAKFYGGEQCKIVPSHVINESSISKEWITLI